MASFTMKDTADSGRAMSFELPSVTPDPGSSPTPRPAVAGVSAAGYTLLGLDDASADGTAFGERKGRFSGAFGTSVAAHILFILLFWGLTLLPAPAPNLAPEQPFDTSQLVWANVPGPGGGGGGGGNEMKEPPKKMETKPADKLAVPVAKPPPQVPKELPKEPPPQVAELNIPVRPMDAGQLPQTGMAAAPTRAGALEIDHFRREVRVGGAPVPLTPTELKLIEALARAPGRAFTREELVARAFGPDYDGTERTVDTHITNLRRKLERGGCAQAVDTVHGVGYRLAVPGRGE